jgi:N-methylhydantoinase A
MPGFAIAVDIGGTFTDVVLRGGDGRVWVDKTLTTPRDLLDGFFRAVDQVLAKAGAEPADVDDVAVHATTIVTNALIERRGPTTALVVTEGFRDVLYIRDEHRYDMYDPLIEFTAPLIPRELTFGIDERVLADGTIAKPVDDEAIRALADELARHAVESVAVCLLNAYRLPDNERRIGAGLRAALPDLFVSLSSEVAPQIREYPRSSTTAINAYTRPITEPYLEALIEEMGRRGFPHRPLIMLSNGGIVGAEVAGRFPVRMIESGPAAGALVARYFADQLDLDDLLSFDMGGTTAKACIIQDRRPLVAGTFEVDRRYRFKPGSGMPVSVPSIDLIEIGAGGGSIAGIGNLGLLAVGPRSAGSEPGPACYGRGGGEPTVTDADLVLGFLDAANFLGGEMTLDVAAAAASLETLGAALGLSAAEAALGVYEVVGESMAGAARAHATDRGIDPRGLPVLAFGGAGPVHACHVAELLDSDTVIFPPFASVLSAFGTLVTPPRLDLVRGSLARIGDIDWAATDNILGEMVDDGRRALVGAGLDAGQIAYVFGADMRYLGQQNEVTVDLAADPRADRDTAGLRERFEAAYEQLYGIRLDDMDVEIVSWRVSALGPDAERAGRLELPGRPGEAKAERDVLLPAGRRSAPVYDRSALAVGQRLDGPAIVEERETTIVLLPGWCAEVNDQGCLVATRDSREGGQ